ncbi:MAG: hypothetical protein Q7T79_02565 [bacterium]|nr:hypothetical protein [bacterium]
MFKFSNSKHINPSNKLPEAIREFKEGYKKEKIKKFKNIDNLIVYLKKI